MLAAFAEYWKWMIERNLCEFIWTLDPVLYRLCKNYRDAIRMSDLGSNLLTRYGIWDMGSRRGGHSCRGRVDPGTLRIRPRRTSEDTLGACRIYQATVAARANTLRTSHYSRSPNGRSASFSFR